MTTTEKNEKYDFRVLCGAGYFLASASNDDQGSYLICAATPLQDSDPKDLA